MNSVMSLVLLSFLGFCAEQQVPATDEEIVRSLYPDRLARQSEEIGLAEADMFAFVAIGDGPDKKLVAAYTNGHGGAVSLIDPSDPPRVLDETFQGGMLGIAVGVRLENLIAGPTPEVVVTFTTPQGVDADWLFEIQGGTLRSIGPTRPFEGITLPALADASYVDLDRDGVMEILNRPAPVSDDAGTIVRYEGQLFRITNDGSAETIQLAFNRQFWRSPGKPEETVDSFPAQPGDATLVMVNGPGEAPHSTAGWVKLNGDVVVTPADFKKGAGESRVPVRLGAANDLAVELAGDPGSSIIVYVTPKP